MMPILEKVTLNATDVVLKILLPIVHYYQGQVGFELLYVGV